MTADRHPDAETVAFNEHSVGIYSGRQLIGEIAIGRSIRAVDRDGNEIGVFKSHDEAMTAIIAEAAKRGERQS